MSNANSPDRPRLASSDRSTRPTCPVHHIIELKIWRGPAREAQALDQLAAYLKAQHQTEGWLLSFADQTHTPRRQQTIDHAGVTIHEYVVAFRDDRAAPPQ
jgi:hypothetical protein